MIASARYTLLICTCDAYEDAWGPLFGLFRKYWPSLDAPIVLNTETKTYEVPGYDIHCPQLYKGHTNPATVPWSKILKETLQKAVETELVLVYLEDFFLRSPVNTDKLDICVTYMETHKEVANLLLVTPPPPYKPLKEYPWLVKRSKRAPYIFGLQAGLWRRDRLIHFLRDHESPWRFEIWGSIRARRYPDDFFAVTSVDGKPPIFDYDQGILRGNWKQSTIDLFVKEGIDVDRSHRPIVSADWKPPAKRRKWGQTAWNIFRSLRP